MRSAAHPALYSAAYQAGVCEEDYEVIVVDNGSPVPLKRAVVVGAGANFRLMRIDNAQPSPIGALNRAIAQVRAPNIAIAIDGARMLSPGVIAHCLEALERFERPIVTTLAMHTGPEPHARSIPKGYDYTQEDELLKKNRMAKRRLSPF